MAGPPIEPALAIADRTSHPPRDEKSIPFVFRSHQNVDCPSAMKRSLFFLLTAALLLGCLESARSQTPALPKAQIVLFTPSDVSPPPPKSFGPRLHQFGEYAEKFFYDEMKRWGYGTKRKEIFERGPDGKISVLTVKGDLKAAGGEYRKKWISRQVLDKLKSEHQVTPAGDLFWIFVYVGDPPAKHSNYRGTGDSKNGGWAVLNYTNLPGKITLEKPIVSPLHDKLTLKGCIHEFGHALGLPHIGPKVDYGLGNTLMGPITRTYRSQGHPNDNEAYLSEASAAILSAHPIFTGDPSFRNKLPKTVFHDLKVTRSPAGTAISVSGRLETNHEVHRIVVIDDRANKPGAYWVKGYVTAPGADATFSLDIAKPQQCRGQLKLLVVYTNGAVTGGGLKRGIGSAKLVPYQFP